jgi:hypothetical protein
MLKKQKIFLIKNIQKRMLKIKLFQDSTKLSTKNYKILTEHIESCYRDEENIKEWMESVAERDNYELDINNCYLYFCPINEMYYYSLGNKIGEDVFYVSIYDDEVTDTKEETIISTLLIDYLLSNMELEQILPDYVDLNMKEKLSNF